MLARRQHPVSPRRRCGLALRLGVVPIATALALAPLPASAAPVARTTPAGTAGIAAPAAALVPARTGAPTRTVPTPVVRRLALSGVSRGVLSVAPAPHAGSGSMSVRSATPRLRPAVAAGLALSRPATLVAVTADAPFPTGTSVQVRVRERGHGWSEWTELEAGDEHGPDPGSAEARRARVGTEPMLAVDAQRVQVRIDTPTGRVPRGTGLALVSAPADPADALVRASSASAAPRAPGGMTSAGRLSARAEAQPPAPAQPPIITRAQWGADESWRSRAPYYTDTVKMGFIHHTASTSNYTRAQAAAQVRAIYAYHTRSLGHSDIDYNFVVDRFGRLYEGRAGGIDRPVLGGHTAGFNENTFAVVALGNFETVNPPADDMAAIRDSVARLFAWKLGLHGVDPGSTATLVSAGYIRATRYPRGSIATLPAISSHRMVNYTSCPGRHMQAQLPAIRALAVRYATTVLSPPTPGIRTVPATSATPARFTATADRALAWRATLTSPCSASPVRTLTGSTSGPGLVRVDWDLADDRGRPVPPARYLLRLSATAEDGTSVEPSTATVVVTPVPGGAWGPCANASRVVDAGHTSTSVLWGRLTAPWSRTVVLTGLARESDAAMATGLVAAPLARSLDAPLLVTGRDSLAPAVAEELAYRRATDVIVVGGTDVVSASVVRAVATLVPSVSRIAGSSPAQTAARVAARMGRASAAVLVSPRRSPAHAVAGASLAASRRVPLLLADDTGVPAVTVAAAKGRPAVTVAASSVLGDRTLGAALRGVPWRRVAGADTVRAGLAVAAARADSSRAVLLLSDDPDSWGVAPVAASTGQPLLFTGSTRLSRLVAARLAGSGGPRAVVAPQSGTWLGEDVLGAASRVLRGAPWAPPPVDLTDRATPTSTLALGAADARPEPVRAGTRIAVSTRVTARYTDGSWRTAAPGARFTVEFRPAGHTRYATVARGTSTAGLARVRVTATRTGWWRIAVGARKSGADRVVVTR